MSHNPYMIQLLFIYLFVKYWGLNPEPHPYSTTDLPYPALIQEFNEHIFTV